MSISFTRKVIFNDTLQDEIDVHDMWNILINHEGFPIAGEDLTIQNVEDFPIKTLGVYTINIKARDIEFQEKIWILHESEPEESYNLPEELRFNPVGSAINTDIVTIFNRQLNIADTVNKMLRYIKKNKI